MLVTFAFFILLKCNTSVAQSDSYEYLNQLTQNGVSKNLGVKIGKLEKQIDGVCDSAIIFLKSYKKDTSSVYGLIKVFKLEKMSYQDKLRNESEMIYMSYGEPYIAKKERQAASDGFYYLALKEKYNFLKAVYDNCIESFYSY